MSHQLLPEVENVTAFICRSAALSAFNIVARSLNGARFNVPPLICLPRERIKHDDLFSRHFATAPVLVAIFRECDKIPARLYRNRFSAALSGAIFG